MCARTLCPFSSSTRNIAFGRGSTTRPSTSIAPSFLAMSSAFRDDVCLPGRATKRNRGLQGGTTEPAQADAPSTNCTRARRGPAGGPTPPHDGYWLRDPRLVECSDDVLDAVLGVAEEHLAVLPVE